MLSCTPRIRRESAWCFTCLLKISCPLAFYLLFAKNIYHVYVVRRRCLLNTNTNTLLSSNLHAHLACSSSHLFFIFFPFETRRLRGERSFRLQPLRKPPLEESVILDGIQLKTQNMTFKSFIDDQTVLQCRYYYFPAPRKVDGGGFLSQTPTLKTVPSDKKSNCKHAQKGVKCPLNSRGGFHRVQLDCPKHGYCKRQLRG